MTKLEDTWLPPPAKPTLRRDEVHVWRALLDLPSPAIEDLQCTLTIDELDRANRYVFERDRRRFIAGRGLLRTILGYYLTVSPDCLRFSYNAYGKPALALELAGVHTLSFNVSHADGLALYVVTYDREIGVDLERIRDNFEYEQIASRFFSATEVARLKTVPASSNPLAFFNCWTRKEAYIKAIGQGLSLALDSFEVSLLPGEPARLLATMQDPNESERWTLHTINPMPGFVGAIAVKGRRWRIKQYDHKSSLVRCI